jgi:hypothetical protein
MFSLFMLKLFLKNIYKFSSLVPFTSIECSMNENSVIQNIDIFVI